MTTNPSESSDSGLSDDYVDIPTLVVRRLSDAANGMVQAIRSQPLAAAAIIAAGVGVAVGLWIANRPRSRREVLRDAVADRASRVGERAGGIGKGGGSRLGRAADYGQLVPLALKLLENPVVRGIVIQAITRRLTRR
jgi:hypothetical protein